MNHIFLGQELQAREQLASGQSLIPQDPSLQLANAILTSLCVKNATIFRSGDSKINFPTVNESVEGEPIEHDDTAVSDRGDFEGAKKMRDRIIDAFPQAKNLVAADSNTVVKEIDNVLVRLHAFQAQMADSGFVIFPPALYRVLSKIEPIKLPPSAPGYWPKMTVELRKVANSNPDMLFLFAFARSVYSKPSPSSEDWIEGEKSLARALMADSIFPIRPIVIQQLAFTRIQIYYYHSGKSETATRKMVDSLKLLNSEGRMPQLGVGYFDNLVEMSLEVGEVELAADFCARWRRQIEIENGTSEQKANALGYSAMVALNNNQIPGRPGPSDRPSRRCFSTWNIYRRQHRSTLDDLNVGRGFGLGRRRERAGCVSMEIVN